MKADFLINLAVMGEACFGIIKDKHQCDKEIQHKVTDLFGKRKYFQRVHTKGVLGECEEYHQRNHDGRWESFRDGKNKTFHV